MSKRAKAARKGYAERCAELTESQVDSATKTRGFAPPAFAEPATPAEQIALDLVRGRFPKHASIRTPAVVELLATFIDAVMDRE